MLEAKTAKEMAQNYETPKIGEVLSIIESRARVGEYSCIIYDTLPTHVYNELKDLGYEIYESIYDHREDGYTTRISWK
jgi:hypothetical protein